MRLLIPFVFLTVASAADPALHIKTPVAPPAWAMLELEKELEKVPGTGNP